MRELEFIQKFLEANVGYVQEKYAGRDALTVTTKSDPNDLLTEVDLTLQKRAVDAIEEQFPGDRFVGEEGSASTLPREPSGRCWVMDPIDGTNNFVRGLFPIFGISLAFALNGEAVAGGIALPAREEIYLAGRNLGATRNGVELRVSACQHLEEARLDLDFSGQPERIAMVQRASRLLYGVGSVRSYGSAVASLAQLASGDIDAYVHMGLNAWDFAAGQVLVEEAGGMATRIDGRTLRLFDAKDGVVFSNGALHSQCTGLIQ